MTCKMSKIPKTLKNMKKKIIKNVKTKKNVEKYKTLRENVINVKYQ